MLRYGGNDWYVFLGIGWVNECHGSSTPSSRTAQSQVHESADGHNDSNGHEQTCQSLELLGLQIPLDILDQYVGIHDEKDEMGGKMLTGSDDLEIDKSNQHGH